jgi:hypothetical protein
MTEASANKEAQSGSETGWTATGLAATGLVQVCQAVPDDYESIKEASHRNLAQLRIGNSIKDDSSQLWGAD